jgi:DNA-binding NarL/FixJ family response regulator
VIALRVVLAEDSLLLRAGIVRLLTEAGFDVVGEAGDGEELLRKVRGHRPDVVVLDLADALSVARALRVQRPEVRVLMLADRIDPGYATELLEQGAAGVGYLHKDRVADLDRFAGALREVARGGTVLDPAVVTPMLERRRRRGPLDALTRREHEVLAGMAEGETNRGIARRLFVSERAVERHVTAIFGKLNLSSSETAHRRVLAVLAYLGHHVGHERVRDRGAPAAVPAGRGARPQPVAARR